MNNSTIEKKFNKIGATVKFEDNAVRKAFDHRKKRYFDGYGSEPELPKTPTLDVVTKDGKEVFIVDTFENNSLDVQILDLQPDDRHLLLMIRDTTNRNKSDKNQTEVTKYLCGHDERHWFVAAIPESAYAKNVEEAKEALKPGEVRNFQKQKKVKTKNKHKRKNKGFIRQGEWFFVPDPFMDASVKENDYTIFKKEPISRGRGSKPHICENLIREGGVLVYVHRKHAPSGFTEDEYNEFIKNNNPDNLRLSSSWSKMVRDAEVYIKGYIRHPDHATITLNTWHRVFMNEESKANAMKNVAFLD